jgi:hypothetical protein
VSIIIEVLEAEPRAKLIMDQEAMDEMLLAELHDYMMPSLSASSRIPFSDGCKEQGTIDLLDILRLARAITQRRMHHAWVRDDRHDHQCTKQNQQLILVDTELGEYTRYK